MDIEVDDSPEALAVARFAYEQMSARAREEALAAYAEPYGWGHDPGPEILPDVDLLALMYESRGYCKSVGPA